MSANVPLEIRDALARIFIAASAGDRTARTKISQLHDWSEAGSRPPEIETENRRLLFVEWGEIHPAFEEAEPYVRDRALRFEAACRWIEAESGQDEPLERARAAWDAGLFFEVHELLEPVWLAEAGAQRPLLQGWILAATALHKFCEGDGVSARGLLADGAKLLAADAPHTLLDWAKFCSDIRVLERQMHMGEVTDPGALKDIPRLQRAKGR